MDILLGLIVITEGKSPALIEDMIFIFLVLSSADFYVSLDRKFHLFANDQSDSIPRRINMRANIQIDDV